MIEGFWILQFEGLQASGGGVVFLVKERIYGGDSGFVYTGRYQSDGNTITGRVKVHNFLPAVPSVFGISGDYELSLSGNMAGNVIKGQASLVSQEGMGIVFKLSKVGDLPS